MSHNITIASGTFAILPTAGKYCDRDIVITAEADTSLSYPTDEEIAYRKNVPIGAKKYALLKSIGGMTRKCNNLIPFPYAYKSTTLEGITFTVGDNGIVTLNGTTTLTDGVKDFILAENLYLPNGTYTLSGVNNGGLYTYRMFLWVKKADNTDIYPSNTFTLEQGDYIYRITIRFGYQLGTANNIVVTPMLNEGSTALPYEPYFEGLRDSKVTEIVSRGANLFDSSNVINTAYGTVEIDGNNLIITSRYFVSFGIDLKANTEYFIQGTTTGDVVGVALKYTDGTIAARMTVLNRTFIPTQDVIEVYIYSGEGTSSTTTYSNLMIFEGSVSRPYAPYREPISYPIPKALQDIDGYGWGINEYYFNYADWVEEQFIPNVKQIVFDGTEQDWSYELTGTGTEIRAVLTNISGVTGVGLCNKFSYGDAKEVGQFDVVSNRYIRFNVYGLASSMEEWKALLAQWSAEGNPLVVYYALTEPIITDISDILTDDNFIEVESGGTLEFVNEYKNAVPSTIKYTVVEVDIKLKALNDEE